MEYLVDLQYVQLQGNHISGAVLPPMNFSNMLWGCSLFFGSTSVPKSNQFLCPWPQGAVGVCQKLNDTVPGPGPPRPDPGHYIPITDADCTPTPAPSGL